MCNSMEINCEYNVTGKKKYPHLPISLTYQRLLCDGVNDFTSKFAACTCTFKGNKYQYGETIYNTTDGLGHCMTAVCEKDGEIKKDVYPCPATHSTTHAPTTAFNFSSTTTGNCVLHSSTSYVQAFILNRDINISF